MFSIYLILCQIFTFKSIHPLILQESKDQRKIFNSISFSWWHENETSKSPSINPLCLCMAMTSTTLFCCFYYIYEFSTNMSPKKVQANVSPPAIFYDYVSAVLRDISNRVSLRSSSINGHPVSLPTTVYIVWQALGMVYLLLSVWTEIKSRLTAQMYILATKISIISVDNC